MKSFYFIRFLSGLQVCHSDLFCLEVILSERATTTVLLQWPKRKHLRVKLLIFASVSEFHTRGQLPVQQGLPQTRVHRQKLCRRFRFCALQVPTPTPVVGMLHAEIHVVEVAVQPT